jgi:hypothetical protein
MSRRKTRDEWLQDIQARQRNIVFPDTANNEARFWRNLMDGAQRLTVVQRIGIALMALAVGMLVLAITFHGNNPFESGFSWSKLGAAGIEWLIAFGILAFILLLFRVSQGFHRK